MKTILLIAVIAGSMCFSVKACKVTVVDTSNLGGWCVSDGNIVQNLIETTCPKVGFVYADWSANLSTVLAAILAQCGAECAAAIIAGTVVKVTGTPGRWTFLYNFKSYVSATLHPEDHRWTYSDRKPEAGEYGYNSTKNATFNCFATVDYPDCLGGVSHQQHVFINTFTDIIADDQSGSCF